MCVSLDQSEFWPHVCPSKRLSCRRSSLAVQGSCAWFCIRRRRNSYAVLRPAPPAFGIAKPSRYAAPLGRRLHSIGWTPIVLSLRWWARQAKPDQPALPASLRCLPSCASNPLGSVALPHDAGCTPARKPGWSGFADVPGLRPPLINRAVGGPENAGAFF